MAFAPTLVSLQGAGAGILEFPSFGRPSLCMCTSQYAPVELRSCLT